MARDLNLDTVRQEFWKESLRKEVKLRNKWFQGYFGSNRLPDNLTAQENKSPVPISKIPKPTRIHIKPAPVTPTGRASDREVPNQPLPAPGTKFTEMRIPSPETKQMIYTGLSAEGEGRKAYLVKRKVKGPEEKFEYPLTSASEVGWNIKEVTKNAEKPAFYGKSKIIRDTFFRTNGDDGCF